MCANVVLTAKPVQGAPAGMAALLRLLAISAVCVALAELIGQVTVPLGGSFKVVLLPLVWVLAIGAAWGFAKTILPRPIRVDEGAQTLAAAALQPALLLIMVKSGLLVGDALPLIARSGWALVFQEFGHFLGTAIFGLPLALLLGLKREAIGATFSVGREPSLAIISEKYGMASAEGRGVLAEYITSTLLGAAFVSVLAGFLTSLGIFNPLALAMGAGLGSGSMMTAAAGAIAAQQPAEMAKQVTAFAAASNLITTTLGAYFTLYISLPFTVWAYELLEPVIGRFGTRQAPSHAGVEPDAESPPEGHPPPLLAWPQLLAIWIAVASFSLIGAFRASGTPPDLDALAGLAIMVAIAASGFAVYRVARGVVPALIWVSIISMLLASPGTPLAAPVVALTGKLSFAALGTPVLALAGLSIAKDLPIFRKLGWRIVLVSLMANAGTFLGATLIAQFFEHPSV